MKGYRFTVGEKDKINNLMKIYKIAIPIELLSDLDKSL